MVKGEKLQKFGAREYRRLGSDQYSFTGICGTFLDEGSLVGADGAAGTLTV